MSDNAGFVLMDREEGGLYEKPNFTGSPERNLLMAVLERAILDLVGNDSMEASEAEKWLFGEVETPSFRPFTFPWLCQELDLDYRDISETIKKFPKRGQSRIAPWYLTKNYATHAA